MKTLRHTCGGFGHRAAILRTPHRTFPHAHFRVRAVTGQKAAPSESTPMIKESLLGPGVWQQTLWKSFTLGGIGMHSGEVAYVRVMPAHAGEGRYFVRVPPGTNSHLYMRDEDFVEEQVYPPPEKVIDEDAEDERVELFLEYLQHCEENGFMGSFFDYAKMVGKEDEEVFPDDGPEKVKTRSEDEGYVIAHIDNAAQGEHRYCTTLGEGENKIMSVEHLLSALEACGVDNARLEIEGGVEVPTIDGAAFGWCEEIYNAGIAAATCVIRGKEVKVRRAALKLTEPFSIHDGERSITLVPDECMKVSYGMDSSTPVIGKQWHSWCLQDGRDAFPTTVAPARSFTPSMEDYYCMREEGFVKGATEGVLLVGNEEEWCQGDLVQFDNEPARHKVVDLVGDLSLLSLGGMSGLPYGHIIAYNADHQMHLQFVRALKEKAGEHYYEGYRSDPYAPIKGTNTE